MLVYKTFFWEKWNVNWSENSGKGNWLH